MFWIAIAIYCLLIISPFILERLMKRKFNLPKNFKYKRFNKSQTLIEILIAIIFIIGGFMASISVYEDGIYRSLNPIPVYLWLSLFMLVIFGFRGYMAKRFAKGSREYYIYFAFAVWNPIIIIIAYYTTEFF
ncbi:DUF4181 domain-containing protein [Peribacillus loiseleuriae]|uniref:DUF4181 domain-containing protein n=1 Tax=Peribacillus loiseleuriae TaxID=1679170 RepID=UPI0037FBDD96